MTDLNCQICYNPIVNTCPESDCQNKVFHYECINHDEEDNPKCNLLIHKFLKPKPGKEDYCHTCQKELLIVYPACLHWICKGCYEKDYDSQWQRASRSIENYLEGPKCPFCRTVNWNVLPAKIINNHICVNMHGFMIEIETLRDKTFILKWVIKMLSNQDAKPSDLSLILKSPRTLMG